MKTFKKFSQDLQERCGHGGFGGGHLGAGRFGGRFGRRRFGWGWGGNPYWDANQIFYQGISTDDNDPDEVKEAEGAPTNSAGSGNIAGIGVASATGQKNFAEPGVDPIFQRIRKQVQVVGPPIVADPRIFRDKIFGHGVQGPMKEEHTRPEDMHDEYHDKKAGCRWKFKPTTGKYHPPRTWSIEPRSPEDIKKDTRLKPVPPKQPKTENPASLQDRITIDYFKHLKKNPPPKL